jgi:hypothetical protein
MQPNHPSKLTVSLTSFWLVLALALGFAQQITQAQTTAQDSGWVDVFNGKDFTGFYTYFETDGVVDITKQDAFTIDSGMVYVPKAKGRQYSSKEGHLITTKTYSWYRVRLDYKFGVDSGSQNAGFVFHIDNESALAGKVKALRPTSIEVNMRRIENSPWTLWSAWNLGPYISTTVKQSTNSYQSKQDGGVNWTNDPWGQRTIASSYTNSEKPMGQWNHGEAFVYGDSLGIFYLNGQLRTSGWNFRLRGSANDSTTKNRTPYDHGGIGIQSENQEIWYRKYQIMELEPHTLKPIHAKTTALANQRMRSPTTLQRGVVLNRLPSTKFMANGRKRISVIP